MAKQIINIGSSPNKGDGDPLRTAFTKINNNFNELYTNVDNIVTFSGSYNDLTDTPTLFDGSYNSLTDTPDLSQYISRTEFDTGTITIDVNNTGDLVGSVFADDSTLLVDSVNGVIPYSVLDGAPTALSNFSNDLDYTAIVGGAIQTNGLPIGTEASGLFAKDGQSLVLGYKDSGGTAFSHISLSESNNIQIQADVTVAASTTFDFNDATVNGLNINSIEKFVNRSLFSSNTTVTSLSANLLQFDAHQGQQAFDEITYQWAPAHTGLYRLNFILGLTQSEVDLNIIVFLYNITANSNQLTLYNGNFTGSVLSMSGTVYLMAGQNFQFGIIQTSGNDIILDKDLTSAGIEELTREP